SHFLFLCYVPPSALHSVPTRRSSDLKGDIVAFPTDTVYGLGADATNEEAVLKIFEAKGRPADGPISVLVSQVDDLDKYAKEVPRSEEHTSELQSRFDIVCRLLLEKKK